MYDIIASIVTFKNDKDVLKKAIDSFLGTDLKVYLYVIDNSPTNKLKDVCMRRNVEYIFSNKNLGFGAGHNIAIRKMTGRTKYALILNPDVYFNKGTIEKLFSFMEENKEVGFVMPKVLYPDGSLQYLCRLLPNPYDMFIRKINFRFLDPLINPRKIRNELRSSDYNKPMDVPYLSGCFMLIKAEAFVKIGIFDERFFIYFEDLDLSRRINQAYRNVYFPKAEIYHSYGKGSDKDIVLFWQIVLSSIKYFNKWGWFFDQEREKINKQALENLYVS